MKEILAPTILSVNLDKVALLRNSRAVGVPDVLSCARVCIQSGAQGITVHPRRDARHITFDDCRDLSGLSSELGFELNIEGELSDKVIKLVEELRPKQFTVVIEQEGELTSLGGWGADQDQDRLAWATKKLELDTRVAVFCDATYESINSAISGGAHAIELFTGPYANADRESQEAQLLKLVKAGKLVREHKLRLNGGHDLNRKNLPALVGKMVFDEFSIGHHLISDSLLEGLSDCVKGYISCIVGAS